MTLYQLSSQSVYLFVNYNFMLQFLTLKTLDLPLTSFCLSLVSLIWSVSKSSWLHFQSTSVISPFLTFFTTSILIQTSIILYLPNLTASFSTQQRYPIHVNIQCNSPLFKMPVLFCTKVQVFTMTHKALADLASYSFWSSLHPFSFAPSISIIWTFLPFCKHVKDTPVSGPFPWLLSRTRKLFPHVTTRPTLLTSFLYLNVILSSRPSLADLYKTAFSPSSGPLSFVSCFIFLPGLLSLHVITFRAALHSSQAWASIILPAPFDIRHRHRTLRHKTLPVRCGLCLFLVEVLRVSKEFIMFLLTIMAHGWRWSLCPESLCNRIRALLPICFKNMPEMRNKSLWVKP